MKKAIDYAQEIITSTKSDGKPDFTVISDVIFKLAKDEFEEISKVRHIRFDSGCIGLLREQEAKWKAIARRVNAANLQYMLKEDAFYDFLQSIPEIKPFIWKMREKVITCSR